MARSPRRVGVFVPVALVALLAGVLAGAPPEESDVPDSVALELPNAGRFGADPLKLLQLERVQEELKLTADQVSELAKIAEVAYAEASAFGEDALKDVAEKDLKAKRGELRQAVQAHIAKFRERVNEVLEEEQINRLKQITLQVSGPEALLDRTVVESLNITREQREQLAALRTQAREGMQKARKTSRDISQLKGDARKKAEAENRDQLNSLTLDLREKTDEILTDSQKEALENLIGEPFELDVSDIIGDGT